jgi:hypothetical protein
MSNTPTVGINEIKSNELFSIINGKEFLKYRLFDLELNIFLGFILNIKFYFNLKIGKRIQ